MWSHCTWGLTQCDAPSPNPPLPIVRCSMLIFLTKSQLYSVCSHPSVFFFSEVCVEVHAVYVYIHCPIYSSIEASHYQQAPPLSLWHTHCDPRTKEWGISVQEWLSSKRDCWSSTSPPTASHPTAYTMSLPCWSVSHPWISIPSQDQYCLCCMTCILGLPGELEPNPLMSQFYRGLPCTEKYLVQGQTMACKSQAVQMPIQQFVYGSDHMH